MVILAFTLLAFAILLAFLHVILSGHEQVHGSVDSDAPIPYSGQNLAQPAEPEQVKIDESLPKTAAPTSSGAHANVAIAFVNFVHRHMWACRIIALLLILISIVLGILWIQNPNGNYEPIMAVLGILAALIGVPSLTNSAKPAEYVTKQDYQLQQRKEAILIALDLLRPLEAGMGGLYPYVDAKLFARANVITDVTPFPKLEPILGTYSQMETHKRVLIEPIVDSKLGDWKQKLGRLWTLASYILSHDEHEEQMAEYHQLASDVSDSYWDLIRDLKNEYLQFDEEH